MTEYIIFHPDETRHLEISRIRMNRFGVWALSKWGRGKANRMWDFYPWAEVASIRRER